MVVVEVLLGLNLLAMVLAAWGLRSRRHPLAAPASPPWTLYTSTDGVVVPLRRPVPTTPSMRDHPAFSGRPAAR